MPLDVTIDSPSEKLMITAGSI